MSSIPLYLAWSSDGELYLLESSGNGLKLCSSAKFSEYETHCISSVLDRNGKLRVFAGRLNFIESFMVDINGDDILINENSYSKISTTNTLGFLRIDAKLISGTGKSVNARGYLKNRIFLWNTYPILAKEILPSPRPVSSVG